MTGPTPEEAVARQYAADGYDVQQAQDMHGAFAAVDLVARRGLETVYIQVKRGPAESSDSERTTELAQMVSAMPDARLDVVFVPGDQSELPDVSTVVRRAGSASTMLATGGAADSSAAEAALVLLASAAEGALRLFAARSGVNVATGAGLTSLAAQLRNEGLLWQRPWEVLERLGSARDRVVHGFGAVLPKQDLAAADDLVRLLTEQVALTSREIVEWFQARYKDPVHGVPYDTGEGGYQYVDGGPFDARDVLENHFEFVPITEIDTAVRELEAEATEWVEKDKY